MSIKNALVVDDSKSARMMLQRLLSRINVHVDTVDSAEAALLFLEGTLPDIIFMDHMMPGMNGLEATQIIRSNPKTSSIPTIMYTSKEGEDYFKMALSHGASGVLGKPANQEAVMAVIKSLDAPAANDDSKNTEQEIPLAEIDHLIQKHVKQTFAIARSDITASIDTTAQQLQNHQRHQLEVIQQQLQARIQENKQELEQALDANALYKLTQPLNQRLAMAVADKLIKKNADDVVAIMHTNKVEQEALLGSHNKELRRVIRSASIMAGAIGALIGSAIGILAALLTKLI
jgi:CheY-like chemotaxis protein